MLFSFYICIMVTCTLTCGKVTCILDPPFSRKQLNEVKSAYIPQGLLSTQGCYV